MSALDLSVARSIARIRYPDLDFDTAWRLANTHSKRKLEACAFDADRNATDLYEQADDEEGPTRRNTLASAKAQSCLATTLRAAVDFLTFCPVSA
jgi:hypothetical protein